MQKLITWITILLLAATLTACDQDASVVLQDPTCEPPCWRGIIPGVTSKTELVSLIEKTTEDYNERFSLRGDGGEITCWEPREVKRPVCAYLENDVLFLLEFSDVNTTIDKAFGLFDEPDHLAIKTTVGDYEERILYLLYAEKGISLIHFDSTVPSRWIQEIQPNTKIQRVWYFDPSDFANLVDDGFIGDAKLVDNAVFEWKGLGIIEDLYPIQRIE